MKPLISVVVCTHNRANLLEQCLNTIVQQTLIPDIFEVLIIDNNSSDNTKEVARKFTDKHCNFMYFIEPQLGLSHARNKGLREAQGEYIAYTDDDCKVPEQWLSIAKEVIEQVKPAAFGGPSLAFYMTPKPRWFLDRFGSHVLYGQEAKPLEKEYIHGMNIFFRKSLFQKLDGFNPALGMSGNKVAYGEETEIIIKIRSTMPGEIIYYHPDLYVHHLVPAKKMSLIWITRERFNKGKCLYKVFNMDAPVLDKKIMLKFALNLFCGLFLDIIKSIINRDHKHYPYIRSYLYEHTARQYVEKLGMIYGQFLQIKK